MRKVNVLKILERVEGKDYVINGKKIKIEKGKKVYVKILGLKMEKDV